MKKRSVISSVILLSPLIFSFAFAMDIYVPAVPHMVKVFQTSQALVQLTLSIFMFVVGIGQLFIGPASDHLGRRKPLFASIISFILGSLVCVTAPSIYVLIFGRIIQALGGCGMMVIAFAIVRDLFSGHESAKVYSFLNCGLAMSPLFAPIIGSYLDHWFGWRAAFIFLIINGIIIFVIAFIYIPETLEHKDRVKVDLSIFSRYVKILTNPNFFAYAFCASMSMMTFFTFFSSSPYIIINLLHVPVKHFGYYFFMIGFTFFIGSLISGKITGQIGAAKTMLIGASIALAAGIIMSAWYLLFGLGFLEFLLPCMLIGIGGAFMLGAGAGGAMQAFGTSAGSAAATLGCLQFLLAAIFGSFIMHIPVTSTLPLSLTMTFLNLLALIVFTTYYFYFQQNLLTSSLRA